jgi:hypothetical protein
MNKIILATVGLMALTGCGKGVQAPSASAAAPAFQTAWIPPATGEGNFEICLDNDAKENGLIRVVVPTNVIMQSWGQLAASLKEKTNTDPRATGGERSPEIDELTAYAVVTTKSVTLTLDQPCKMTTVRAALNSGFRWSHDTIGADQHMAFKPYPTRLKGTILTADQWGTRKSDGVSGNAISEEAFSGYVVKDVGNAVGLNDPS